LNLIGILLLITNAIIQTNKILSIHQLRTSNNKYHLVFIRRDKPMDMILTLDRIDPPWATLETSYGITFYFPLNLLPKGIKEGDVLKFNIEVDQEATKERVRKILGFIDELKQHDNGGDF